MEKDIKYYQELMRVKFDWEDKMTTLSNLIFRKKNEKLKAAQQLRLTEDQLRLYFKRKRVELEEKE